MRTIRYPLRILNDVYEDDPLQTQRIAKRYAKLQDWYAQEVTRLKRGELLSFTDHHFNLMDHERPTRDWAKEYGIKWGWDIPLMRLKLLANYDFARDNNNKFLLRESLHGFPIMNYALGEGPYKAPKDAEFGGEDFHVVLQGDGGNLIYFIPDQNGLRSGNYVECLL